MTDRASRTGAAGWTRRRFLAGAGAATGVAVVAPPACGGDRGDSSEPGDPDQQEAGAMDVATDPDGVPTTATIAGWIGLIVEQGIRRPGYPADAWTEDFCEERFRRMGLERVRREPVTATRWEPTAWSLEVTPAAGETVEIDCFPVPYSAPVDGLEAELVAFGPGGPPDAAGRATLHDVALITLPADSMATAGSAPADPTGRIVDRDGTLAGAGHTVPATTGFEGGMAPAIDAGAVAFIGSLRDYPGDSHEYYVSYEADDIPIPGVWVSGSDGERLAAHLAEGPVHVRLTVRSTSEEVTTYNIVGELPGADEETVIVGSHHDGPWASAVEDASGVSLVLAQAAYWAARPVEDRPHRLVFLLQAAHMDGGRGLHAFLRDHAGELDRVVLEIHLEHAALEVAEVDGELRPTGLADPRWFFTSRIPQLEQAVYEALVAEELDRSLVVAPDAIGDQPPTDGAFFYSEGVPIVHFLGAPFYLFDRMDTLDKVDEGNLAALTRATVRIVESTRGTSAAAMRAGDLLR